MAPLGPFPADRRVAAAVSGGADSTALALLLAGWGRPLALIVDHGLRPESAGEAERTAERLRAFGVPSRVLRAGLEPGPGAAERARAARYALLSEACRELGCVDLVLGHHRADQAETVLLREEAGSGAAGLAGMPAIGFRAEVRLVRPLLTLPPQRLRATLRHLGVPWVEDPTNRDPSTGRGRLRAGLDQDAVTAALARAAREGPARRGAEQGVQQDLADVRFAPEGYAVVLGQLGPEALAALIWAVAGRAYPPPRASLAAGLLPRTVHGVLLRQAGRLGPGTLVAREPDAVGPPVAARAGAVWDGRWRLGGAPPHGLVCAALGGAAARFRRASALPASVLRSLPALWRDDALFAVPHLGFPDAQTCRSLPVWFCPARPAAGAPFVPAAVNPREGQGM